MSQLIPVCASADLSDKGKGVRFSVTVSGEDATGFVVRHHGVVQGYLNRCAHVPVELDWNEGEFFESSGVYLVCSVHGAMYTPEAGRCIFGPCRGKQLRKLQIVEENDQVFWQPDEYVTPARA